MKFLKRHDANYALLLPVFLLFLLSIWVQHQASVMDGNDPSGIVFRQIVFCVLSAIALFVTSLIPTNLLLRFSGLLYVLALGLMASLHWFYDQTMFEQTHTKRWIR
ncbi:MAG: FtsW/RodA/SpoVE family cell cycle protein, partial [Enterococcus casseliflavus]|nr:FtsW/RodA/SpoVE family cell cycle protein [Enterococcus casseliflavus]